MRISEQYKSLNEQLHRENDSYGTSGLKWVADISRLAKSVNTVDILDYGCGKSTFAQNFPIKVRQYDPCVPKFAAEPEPADIVICTDVLEHIEPESMDEVLAHLRSLTKKVVFLAISTRLASKTLPDGRNAHLSVHEGNWWLQKLLPSFHIRSFASGKGEVVIVGEPIV